MDEELKLRIADFFSAGELPEYLGISAYDILCAFPDELEDALEDILELMGVSNAEDVD
jgi:hypothetical protein